MDSGSESPSRAYSAEPQSLTKDDRKLLDVSREFDHLQKRLRISGMFSSIRTYSADAPNPALEFKDLGVIGLPLSARNAAALQSYGASFEGGRDAYNGPFRPPITVMGGTCLYRSIDERQIVFHHPKWSNFIEKASQDARLALGIQAETRCHLARFILQARPKSVRYRVDTPSLALTGHHLVGTMAIIPCSHYAGGDVTVSSDAGTTCYTPGGRDTFSTTCIAWRRDATVKLGSLTHGARIVLLFAITSDVHPSRALLPVDRESLSRLGRCFSSWERSGDDLGDSDAKIVHILKDKHPRVNLRADALRGEDARLVAIISEYSSLHGLHLGLASVTGSERAAGHEMLERRDPEYGELDYDIEDDDDVWTWVYMENLMNPQGQLLIGPVSSEDPHWGKKMSMASRRKEVLRVTEHDEEELEHLGDSSITVTRGYHRAALVIWPSWGASKLLTDPDGKPFSSSRYSDEEDEVEDADRASNLTISAAHTAGETPMVTIKQRRSISPLRLPSTLDAFRPGDVTHAEGSERWPVKRKRSRPRSITVKSEEMDVDRV